MSARRIVSSFAVFRLLGKKYTTRLGISYRRYIYIFIQNKTSPVLHSKTPIIRRRLNENRNFMTDIYETYST